MLTGDRSAEVVSEVAVLKRTKLEVVAVLLAVFCSAPPETVAVLLVVPLKLPDTMKRIRSGG